MSELAGKRVVITRPRSQAKGFASALQDAGATPVYFPVIEISPAEDTVALDRALAELNSYDWMVLTSVNGVAVVWQRLDDLDLHAHPQNVRVAAIGPKTAAALQTRAVQPDFVPTEYVAEAILPGLGDLRGRWVLLPRAELARPDLANAIEAAGGVAHEIAVYRTLPATPDPSGLQVLQSGVDIVTFTSSSTVKNFVQLVNIAGLDAHRLPGNPIFACIGPITADTARKQGFDVAVVAQEYTTEGLLKALQVNLQV